MKFRSALFFFTAFCFITVQISAAAPADDAAYRDLMHESKKMNSDERISAAKIFLKKFPESQHVPDARIIIAENELSPARAITEYRKVIHFYRHYPRRDFAYYKLCQIRYLTADWENLIHDAGEALTAFPKSSYAPELRVMLTKAYLATGKFEEAIRESARMSPGESSDETFAESMLIEAYSKHENFNNEKYTTTLIDVVTKHADASAAPPALYLLGRYYERVKKNDYAYSAYKDLLNRYPRSAEAAYAEKRIAALIVLKPRYTRDYLLGGTENAYSPDVNPETDVDETAETGVSYALAVGPFDTKTRAAAIKKILLKDFSPVTTASKRGEYFVYAGNVQSTDAALALKIRLAEEYQLNSTIVTVKKDGSTEIIYGD